MLIAIGLFYLKDYRSAPTKPHLEMKIESEEAQTKKQKPPLENLVQTWISFRRMFSPESAPPGYNFNLLSDDEERQAKIAESLLKRLINLDPEKNEAAVKKLLDQLANIGYPAIKPILEMLQTIKSERPLSLLLRALTEIPDVEIAPHLKPLIITHPSLNIRQKTMEIFLSRATPKEKDKFTKEVEKKLSEFGRASMAKEKTYLIEALGALDSPKAFALLSDIALHDLDINNRKAAILSLGSLSSSRKDEFLLETLKNERLLRKAAAKSLMKNPSDYITESIIEIIDGTSDKQLKLTAISILGEQKNERSQTYLLDLLQSTNDQQILQAAFNAAGQTKSGDMARSLLDLLNKTEDPRQRRAIVGALAHMGDAAIPYLKEAAQNDDQTIRHTAIQAISRIKKPEAYEALKDIVANWENYDPASQQSALTGLRNFNNTEVVGAVEQIATESPHHSVRRAALETAAQLNKQNEISFIRQVYEKDEADIVKKTALRLMQRYGNRETANFLRQELLQGNNPHLRGAIEQTINFIESRKSK